MEIKRVGVVGMTGFMGIGIAQVCGQFGYQVVGSSRSEERVSKALATIDSRLARGVAKGMLSQRDKDAITARIRGTSDMNDFQDCDLVIESVAEDMEIKKKVFAELDEICPPHAILTTNTSCLSIIGIAMATKRPEKVLGLHFLSPVPQSKLMEIVTTTVSSTETLEIGKSFASSLQKSIIVTKDTPGFVFNRLYIGLSLMAVRLLESGIATREEIDSSMTLGLGHPIGPLALLDFNGIDTILNVANAMYEDLKDPLYAPPILMRRMVAAGWLGRKTGKGFYDYD
jgi:3-hydroxybutyryl-CoA dehydrogenase